MTNTYEYHIIEKKYERINKQRNDNTGMFSLTFQDWKCYFWYLSVDGLKDALEICRLKRKKISLISFAVACVAGGSWCASYAGYICSNWLLINYWTFTITFSDLKTLLNCNQKRNDLSYLIFKHWPCNISKTGDSVSPGYPNT